MKKVFLILLFFPYFGFGQQTINDSILVNSNYRSFITYIPSLYQTSQPVPLVLNFHGLTGNSFSSMFHSDFRSIADTASFIIVYPQGLLNSTGQTHWNVGQLGTSIDDIEFISLLLDSLSSKYNINSDRVYSTGMSNGAYMSYRLSCDLSDKIAAIAPVAGSYISYMLNSCNPTHPTPILHIHGVADSSSIYYGKPGVESVPSIISFWLNYNQCDTQSIFIQIPDINIIDSSTVEHYVWKNCINEIDVEHFKIIDGGHTWPGSNFPNVSGGITNYDINASLEIWKFFSRYDIYGLINSPLDIVENNIERRGIIKVIDLFGREAVESINTLLFYIYNDGTVEKKIILE